MTIRTYKEVQKDSYLYCASYHTIACRAIGSVETQEDGSVCVNGYIVANGDDFVDNNGRIFSDVFQLAESIKKDIETEIVRYETYIKRLNHDIAGLRSAATTQEYMSFRDLKVGDCIFRSGLLSDEKVIIPEIIDTVEVVDNRLYINGLYINLPRDSDVEIKFGERIFSDAYRLHQKGIEWCSCISRYLKGCIEESKHDAWAVYNNNGKPIPVGKGKKTNELWE